MLTTAIQIWEKIHLGFYLFRFALFQQVIPHRLHFIHSGLPLHHEKHVHVSGLPLMYICIQPVVYVLVSVFHVTPPFLLQPSRVHLQCLPFNSSNLLRLRMLSSATKWFRQHSLKDGVAGYEYTCIPAGSVDPFEATLDAAHWKKLGNQSSYNVFNAKKEGDEASIALSYGVYPKFVLKGFAGQVGEVKHLQHKRGIFKDVLVRAFRPVVSSAELEKEDAATCRFDVKFTIPGNGCFTREMEECHNIGYATVLVREYLRLEVYHEVQFVNLPSQHRCNMLKSLKSLSQGDSSSGSRTKKHALKRPAATRKAK